MLTRVNKLWNFVKRENRRGIIEKMKLKNVYLKKIIRTCMDYVLYAIHFIAIIFFFF